MAQLVAHHTGSVGVTGSNPVSSTTRTLILIQSERPFVLPRIAAFWLVRVIMEDSYLAGRRGAGCVGVIWAADFASEKQIWFSDLEGIKKCR